jgi:trigger factor
MKVTQEKLPASQIGLEIEITPEMSQQAYEKTLQEFTRYADIPGFRKGKVPRQVLIQKFGSTRIKATVVEDLIQNGLQQAIEQEKIEAIGQPELRSSFDELVNQFQPSSGLTFLAAVDVVPDVTLGQYSGLEVKAEETKYDPERVDQVLEDYRKRSATLVPVEDRSAQSGDVAIVDFAGRLTGDLAEDESADIPGGSAEDFEIELSEGRFIPGFVDGVIGMQTGETKEVAVNFPEDYPQPDLAGRPAAFTITLKELKQRELPDLDDDFAQDVSEFETLAELRESLESRFQKEAEQKTKQQKEEALLNHLVENLEVDLPETMMRREIDHSITQTAMQLGQQGMDIKKTFTKEIVSMLREQARPEALTRLKRTLVLGEVAKREAIEVDSEAVQSKVNELLNEYAGQDIDVDRLREVVQEDLLREKILGWLEEHNTIELVPEGSLKPAEEEAAEAEIIADEANAVEPEASTATVEVKATEVTEEVAEEVAASSELAVEATGATVAEATSEPETAVPQGDAVPETPDESETEAPVKAKGTTKKAKSPESTAKKPKTTKPSS